MQPFGIDEYNDRNSFEIKCKKCGRNNARIVPISIIKNNVTERIVLEIRCICGNIYGATIYEFLYE